MVVINDLKNFVYKSSETEKAFTKYVHQKNLCILCTFSRLKITTPSIKSKMHAVI